MKREALNITLTDTLRRAQIKERLDTLAGRTALAPTQLAGRALTVGLALIEADLRLIFPDSVTPGAATPSADTQHAAEASSPQQVIAHPRMVSTAQAAAALGYREESAFRQHCQRHPELKRLARKEGRALLWNLPKLSDEYKRREWQPKH